MNNTPLLEMEGISKRFPGVVALDQVNLTVGEGEVVALIGENGAGKSTLMNIVGGAIARDGGTIKINGEPVQISKYGKARLVTNDPMLPAMFIVPDTVPA